jgi:hypothetical protein
MKTHLNLLPIGYLRTRLVRRRLALWTPVWAAVALLGVVNWCASYDACSAAARTLEVQESRYAPLRRKLEQIGDMRRRIDELNHRETMLSQLSEPHPPLAGIALVGRSAAQCEGRVRVNHLLLERQVGETSSGRRSAPAAGEATARSLLTLEGTGLDNLAVATFVEALRDTGAFLRVELKSTVRAGNEIGAMRQFVVTCEY